MTLNKFLRLLCLTGAALVPNASVAQAVVPPEDQPISGSCVVTLGVAAYKKEACEFSAGAKEVPAGFRLVIEHVSAACTTAPGRGIFTLALIAKSRREEGSRMVHIPLRLQAAMRDQVRLTGSEMVRIYAGSETTVELLVSTTESALAGYTTCELNFSGFLTRVNQ